MNLPLRYVKDALPNLEWWSLLQVWSFMASGPLPCQMHDRIADGLLLLRTSNSERCMSCSVLQVASPRAPSWVNVIACSVIGGFDVLGICSDRKFVEAGGAWSVQRHCIFRLMDIVALAAPDKPGHVARNL